MIQKEFFVNHNNTIRNSEFSSSDMTAGIYIIKEVT